MDTYDFGEKFFQYLGRNDYSQAWLARKLAVDRSTVNKWITGENQIKPDKLQECCELFKLNEHERVELFTIAGYEALIKPILGVELPIPVESKAYDAILYTEPDNLRKPGKLYGREALLKSIHGFLDCGKHVLLTGFGGSGKTAIAATVADERIVSWGGAVLWLSSGGEKADEFFEKLLVPLGRQQELGAVKGDARVYGIKRILMQSSVRLIVLDDFRTAELLPQIRQAIPPSIPLLITSRQDWANVDECIKVTNLPSAESLQLLAERAQNPSHPNRDYLDDPDAKLLCEKLDHHPLTVVIAGTWLRQSKRSASHLLARLKTADDSALTLAMPSGFAEQGHMSMSVILDETFRVVTADARTVFQAFGALTAPYATANFLGKHVGKECKHVEVVLDELIAWNLIEREQDTFYSLHDLVHSYARLLCLKGKKYPQKRLVLATQEFIQSCTANFEELHFNLPNILHAAEVADDEQCLAIIAQLALQGYQDNYGHRLDYLRLLDRSLHFIEKVKDKNLSDADRQKQLHHLLCKRGNAHFDRGEYLHAVEIYQRALGCVYNSERRVKTLGLIGKSLMFNGDNRKANQYFSQARQLTQEIPDKTILGFVLEQQAHAAGFVEDYEMARRVAAEQVRLNELLLKDSESREIEEALFYSLNNLGTAELRLGQKSLTEVIEIHQRAEQIALKLQSPEMKAHVFWSLSEDYHTQGERDKASHYLIEAHKLYKMQNKYRDEQMVSSFMRKFGYLPEKRDA